ncbi:MAG: IPExxxVDY family protein [Bacteroidia bacterium]|nr:IPExxxVDY family protein [Bacteroidia bacterium]
MKTTPKIKRVQLRINQNDESGFLGIVSSEPDYKLSLALNKNLKISLKNTSPVIINDEPDNELTFSRFSDSSASQNLIYDLTSNRSGKNYLIRKLKNIDYIFRIHDPDNEININQVISTLRDAECVTAVFNIDIGSIKDRNLNHLIH